MKVLFIHNRYKYYGGEDVAVEMENDLLLARGHETQKMIFDNDEIGGFVSKVKTGIGAIYNKNSAARLRKKITTFKPDVIHVHNLFFVASPSILIEATKHGIPVIVTLHNYRLVCANALLLRDNKVCELCVPKVLPLAGIRYKCYRNSRKDSTLVTAVTSVHKMLGTWQHKVNRYIVLTEFAKAKFLNSALKIESDKFVVKPNFVHDDKQGSQSREKQYLFVGRLSVEKGVHTLLEAFRALDHLKLIVAGEGPDLQKLSVEFADCSNINFLGKQEKPEILRLMKTSKALIFPSIWYEGLPFTIVEAFSTGTPVIASDLGAMKNMISDGYNGYHFSPGNSNDLIAKIALFESAPNNSALYMNARETYEQHYHPDIHYKSVMKIYHEVIHNQIA